MKRREVVITPDYCLDKAARMMAGLDADLDVGVDSATAAAKATVVTAWATLATAINTDPHIVSLTYYPDEF